MEATNNEGAPPPLVGVLGGMGPAATADFFSKLVRATPASVDQAHIRVAIWSDPTVPDRTAALLGRGPDPTEAIAAGADKLVSMGCDLIAIPCNTAHAFVPRIRESIGIPLVHIIEQTVQATMAVCGRVRQIGVLATTGTLLACLYDRELARHDVEAIRPRDEDQSSLMAAIAAIKAGRYEDGARQDVRRIADRLVDDGAEALILGCSEVPLLLADEPCAVPRIDSTQCLAEAVVARAWGQRGGPYREDPAQGLSSLHPCR